MVRHYRSVSGQSDSQIWTSRTSFTYISSLDKLSPKYLIFAIRGCQNRNHSAEKIGAGSSFDHFKTACRFDCTIWCIYGNYYSRVHVLFLNLNSIGRDVPQQDTCLCSITPSTLLYPPPMPKISLSCQVRYKATQDDSEGYKNSLVGMSYAPGEL
jgi:hypothetical protein